MQEHWVTYTTNMMQTRLEVAWGRPLDLHCGSCGKFIEITNRAIAGIIQNRKMLVGHCPHCAQAFQMQLTVAIGVCDRTDNVAGGILMKASDWVELSLTRLCEPHEEHILGQLALLAYRRVFARSPNQVDELNCYNKSEWMQIWPEVLQSLEGLDKSLWYELIEGLNQNTSEIMG
ncbi:MAG: hypothetical protein AAF921_15075 [Cyanobacteria bacterium P01_D01_bin.44]